MKILPPVEKKTDSVNWMSYDAAIKHIYNLFGIPESDCKFTEECICGFHAIVENCQVVNVNVDYDKIWIELHGKPFLWPIQKYTCKLPQDEEKQLLEKLRK